MIGKSAIMEAHGKEIKNIEFLAGLDAQLIQGQEILKERLLTIPNGWRSGWQAWWSASGCASSARSSGTL